MAKPDWKQPYPQKCRERIESSKVLSRLIGHVEGTVELTASQVTAGLGLLKKTLPDAPTVQLTHELEKPPDFHIHHAED